jgi:hypothetical protein
MFQAAGMMLPLRDSGMIEKFESAATQNWVIGSRTVH